MFVPGMYRKFTLQRINRKSDTQEGHEKKRDMKWIHLQFIKQDISKGVAIVGGTRHKLFKETRDIKDV